MTTAPARIVRLKITLDDVEPAVMRRVEVPLGITLSDLHLVIQAIMPWWDYHLYEFSAGRKRWALPDPDGPVYGPDLPDARKVTLEEVLEGKGDDALSRPGRLGALAAELQAAKPAKPIKSLKYLYDFGDGWEHSIKVEAITEALGVSYPRLVDAKGRCPPEDCGGPYGYDHYLAVIGNPNHKEHADLIAWRGPGFDPGTVDVAEIEVALAKLARKFSGRRAKPAPKSRPQA